MSTRIHVQIFPTPEAVAHAAAEAIADQVRTKPDSVLGFATGSTPEKTYVELARLHREQKLSFARVTSFNLDEYLGLDSDHAQSYRAFMQDRLFQHIDIKPWNTHVLNGRTLNPRAECEAFELKIAASGGIDLWLLGIGTNGHVAFNEPGSSVDSRTRLVALSQSTIEANSDGRFFSRPQDVPRCALTAGISTIRESRSLLLLATGPKKAQAVANALHGPFTPDCPASLLQDHPDCRFFIDQEAASLLPNH